jgi:glycosyltransferase involved in cell wall biosynthesis
MDNPTQIQIRLETVCLVATHDPRTAGSMQRYCDVVCSALDAATDKSWKPQVLHLGGLPNWAQCLHPSLRTWLRHGAVWIRAQKLRAMPGQVYHLLDGSYGYLIPLLAPASVVVTVHDLIPHLQCSGQLNTTTPHRIARKLISKSLAGLSHAKAIVTDSTCTAHDVIEAGISEEKISVVHIATQSPSNTADRQPVHDNYILHVGHNGFYKNRLTVLKVFARIREREDVFLKLVGPPLSASEDKLACHLGVHAYITVTSHVSDSELAALYRNARILLFPSIYEGFGWPPLEAMRQGCPVVCSNAASLPEIVGNAALTAEPTDVTALTALCMRVLLEQELTSELITEGYHNLNRFTLVSMGQSLADIYARALEKHNP